MSLNRLLPVLFVSLALCVRTANADRLILTTGEEREGIVKDDPTSVEHITFTDYRSTIRLPRSKIKEIIKEEPYKGYLEIGDGYFKNGNASAATEAYMKAGELGAPEQDVLDRLKKTREMAEGKMREDRSRQVQEINDLTAKAANLTQDNDFEAASLAYKNALDLKPAEEQKKEILKGQINLYLQWGKYSADHLDRIGAATQFQRVRELDPGNQEALDHLIEAWKNDPLHKQDVADYYESMVQNDPENLKLQLEAGDAQYKLNAWDKALPHYVKVFDASERKAPTASERLKTCYERLNMAAVERGDYRGAKEIYQDYMSRFKDADPKVLNEYDYALKYQAIPSEPKNSPERLDQLANLGLWARSVGLHDKAMKAFSDVLGINPEHELAKQGVHLYAQNSLEDAQRLFKAGNYQEARRLAEKTKETFPKESEIIEQCLDLIERSKIEMTRADELKRESAEKIARNGDEWYAKAQKNLDDLQDVNRRTDVGGFSPAAEARTNLQRAIDSWRQALAIFPRLADKSEMDLNRKISDAQNDLRNLSVARPLPTRIRAKTPRPGTTPTPTPTATPIPTPVSTPVPTPTPVPAP